MKEIILIGLLSLSLVGCLVSKSLTNPKTNLVVLFPHYYNEEVYPIVKLTPELQNYCGIKKQKYISWGNYNCNLGSNPSNQVNLMIALLPRSQIPQNNDIEYINTQVKELPPSAWRTYTIYPQQIIEQAKHIPPSDKPASQKPKHLKTTLTLTLYIDGNGNITQEIKKEYVKVGNPYA